MKRELSLPKKTGPLLFLSAALLIFSGCLSKEAPGDRPLRIGIESGPTQLDPRFATDAYSGRIGNLIFSPLVRLDPSSRAAGDLAESWEVKDSTTFLFHLKKNLFFSDGAPMTSADVKFTFDSILDPKTASPHRKAYEIIDRIETPDDQTVLFKLKKPYSPFLTLLSKGIVSKKGVEKAGADYSLHPIGSGPYQLTEWIPDEKLVLTANPKYEGASPGIKKLIIRIIPEDTIREMELQKGSLDLLENALPPDFLPFLEKDAHFQVIKSPGSAYAYLGLNLDDPVLSKLKVRQALAHGMNTSLIIQEILKGLGKPATGLLTPGHWAYEPDVETYSYDPVLAAKLFDEAGLKPDPKTGIRFQLTYKTSQNDLAKRIGEVLQQEFKEIGVALDVRTFEWGTFYADIRSGNFQVYSLRWIGVQDPDFYFDIFHSSSLPPLGANRGHYANREVDRLIEEGRLEMDPLKRAAVYKKIQKIAAHDLPYISLWTLDNITVLKKDLNGFVPDPSGDFYLLKNLSWSR